ncbi:MAG: hypothetical protein AB7K24_13730 [Gemmataceae bacterium]
MVKRTTWHQLWQFYWQMLAAVFAFAGVFGLGSLSSFAMVRWISGPIARTDNVIAGAAEAGIAMVYFYMGVGVSACLGAFASAVAACLVDRWLNKQSLVQVK